MDDKSLYLIFSGEVECYFNLSRSDITIKTISVKK